MVLAREPHHRWRLIALFLGVTVAGFLLVGAFAWRSTLADRDAKTLASVQRLAVENSKAIVALCILRDDYEQRVESSRLFLRRNPNGVPGISAADIRRQIVNSERTIQALDIIDCERGKP